MDSQCALYEIVQFILMWRVTSHSPWYAQEMSLLHTPKWKLLKLWALGVTNGYFFDHSDWNFVLYTAAPCFPLSFVAIFCFFVDSCSSYPLLLVSLNSAIVCFILHTTGFLHVSVILQLHMTSICFSHPVISMSRAW